MLTHPGEHPPPPWTAVPAHGVGCGQRPPVLFRVQSLQLHHELDLAHQGASTDLNGGRARRRAWQQRLNCQVQHAALQLLFSIFRYRGPFPTPWRRSPELTWLQSSPSGPQPPGGSRQRRAWVQPGVGTFGSLRE